jgi:hypothetical protein
MNTMWVAITGTVHTTDAEIPAHDGQTSASTSCSKRAVRGYVQAEGAKVVNCPKCIARNAR